MNRKTRIASTLALAGLLFVVVVASAFAGSSLLSGYGAPGGGEQAIIGSTHLGGPRGGAGSGGASSSRGSSGASRGARSGGSGTGSGAGGSADGSTRSATGANPTRKAGSRSAGAATSTRGAPSSQPGPRAGRAPAAATPAYVYPSALRSASADSSVFDISGGDLLVALVTIATLALVGVSTIRLARLQR